MATTNDPPVGGPPIALSPVTYERHAEAVSYVEEIIRTRAPRPGRSRFPGLAPGAWAILPAGSVISGAASTFLGTGEVKLCDKTGEILDPNPVPVYNAGGEITTGAYGDRIVRLTWTLGSWAVSCPGGSSA